MQNEYGLIIKDEADKDNPDVPGVYIDDSNLYTSMLNLFSGTDEIIDNIAFVNVAKNDDVTATGTSAVDYDSICLLYTSDAADEL